MIKRAPPSDSANSSEYDLKPDISDDDDENDYEDIRPPKKKSSATMKVKKTPSQTPRVWTAVEDEIFLEIMSKVVKAGMLDAVKNDGRLGYRGGPGIAAHVTAIMKKLKKS